MAMVQASCDGDSKSYAAVWNMYGACDTCKNNSDSDLQKLAKDYMKWKDTNEFKEWENSHMQGFANYKFQIRLYWPRAEENGKSPL